MITNETASNESITATFSPGQTLAGTFTLNRKLSVGILGTTWLARDGESDREVSLLFLPDILVADPRVIDELREQVKQNRKVVHPRILRTYDFIQDAGWAAISSDAVEADTLASLLVNTKNGCFDPSEIKLWISAVCQTLDDAHRANLLHRDISPENILLKKSGDLLIANFGVSRMIQDALDRLTSGQPNALLARTSPQQLDGELPARWDDVYGLGILIYELLTGGPPFHSGDILTQIRKQVPISISERRTQVGMQGEAVPESWERVVAACLSKHTPQRPKSAREVGVKLGTASAVAKAPTIDAAPTPAPAVAPSPAAPTATFASPAEVLDEEILWRTPEPHSRPKVNPASPFAHLLEKVPDTRGERKFPVDKALAVGLACLVVLILVLVSNKRHAPVQKAPDFSTAATPVAATSKAPQAAAPQPVNQSKSNGATAALTAQPLKPAVQTPKPDGIKTLTPEVTVDMGGTPNGVAPGKVQAVEKARASLQSMQKAHDEKAKLLQQAQSDADQAQKALDTTLAVSTASKKAADEAESVRKQREDAETKAAAEADQAQKAAAEKLRLAGEASKAKEETLSLIKQKQDAWKKADLELPELQKAAAEKKRVADEAATAEKDLQARMQLQQLALNEAQSEAAPPTANPLEPAQTLTAQSLGPLAQPLTPIAPDKNPNPIEDAEQLVLNQISQKKQVPAEASPGVTKAPVIYVPNPKSQLDRTLVNSLGMKFAPVGDVLFCIWPVRVRDFEAFAQATSFKGSAWRQPGFKQDSDHPVVNVTWVEAMAFCKWLTEKEQKAGMLASTQIYRLPTDLEWSKGVGLPDETGKTPEIRDMDVPDVYPWGTQWPPPAGSGNYTGEETSSDVAIKGYDDGYAWTSPVGTFHVNQFGLYDMGGNVWQWCMDWWNTEQKQKVLRGASWYNGGLKLSLLSSCRLSSSPDLTTDNYGFRCVVAPETKPKR